MPDVEEIALAAPQSACPHAYTRRAVRTHARTHEALTPVDVPRRHAETSISLT